MNLSSAVSAGSHNQGVNIQTGPNGEVYAVWAIYDSWPSDETALGFAKSSNGGSSFASATRIISNIRGIRTTGVLKSQRVNSFPSMAVDISNGPTGVYIYRMDQYRCSRNKHRNEQERLHDPFHQRRNFLVNSCQGQPGHFRMEKNPIFRGSAAILKPEHYPYFL